MSDDFIITIIMLDLNLFDMDIQLPLTQEINHETESNNEHDQEIQEVVHVETKIVETRIEPMPGEARKCSRAREKTMFVIQ